MFPNAKISEMVALLAVLNPVSIAVGNSSTAWISAANFNNFMAVIQSGVLGTSATLDAKFEQAQDDAGTGTKNITGAAITQIVKATGDNKQALLNLRASQLDVEGGFKYFRLKLTVGTADSIASAVVLGGTPRYAPASAANAATVVQVA